MDWFPREGGGSVFSHSFWYQQLSLDPRQNNICRARWHLGSWTYRHTCILFSLVFILKMARSQSMKYPDSDSVFFLISHLTAGIDNWKNMHRSQASEGGIEIVNSTWEFQIHLISPDYNLTGFSILIIQFMNKRHFWKYYKYLILLRFSSTKVVDDITGLIPINEYKTLLPRL